MYTLFDLLKTGGLALVNEIRCYRNDRCLYIYIYIYIYKQRSFL